MAANGGSEGPSALNPSEPGRPPGVRQVPSAVTANLRTVDEGPPRNAPTRGAGGGTAAEIDRLVGPR